MRLWAASLLFYIYVYAICGLGMAVVRCWPMYASEFPPGLFLALGELLATIQVCAPILDVDLVLANYGLPGVFVQILVLEFLNWYTLRHVRATPCCFVAKDYLEGSSGLDELVTFGLAQVLGVVLSFPVALCFWSLGLHPHHLDALHLTTTCQTDLTVGVALGCQIEGAATFLCRMAELKTEKNSLLHQASVNSLLNAVLTIMGIHLTGMYCNPLIASACTWNCAGVSRLGHGVVYWLGPLTGSYLAEMTHYNS